MGNSRCLPFFEALNPNTLSQCPAGYFWKFKGTLQSGFFHLDIVPSKTSYHSRKEAWCKVGSSFGKLIPFLLPK